MNRIVLIDLSQRELNKRRELEQRASRLEAVENTKGTSGGLTEAQQKELEQLLKLLDSDVPVDALYQTVAAHVARRRWDELAAADDFVLKHGLFGSQRAAVIDKLGPNEREIAALRERHLRGAELRRPHLRAGQRLPERRVRQRRLRRSHLQRRRRLRRRHLRAAELRPPDLRRRSRLRVEHLPAHRQNR